MIRSYVHLLVPPQTYLWFCRRKQDCVTLAKHARLIHMSDKSMFYEEFGQTLSVLELESSSEYFEMPKVDSRDNATTHGAVAFVITFKSLYDALFVFAPCNILIALSQSISCLNSTILIWY